MATQKADGKTPEKDGPTTPTRVFVADGELLYWIQQATGKSSAQILMPMIRPELNALYERYKKTIDQLKAARQEQDCGDQRGTDSSPRRKPPPEGT